MTHKRGKEVGYAREVTKTTSRTLLLTDKPHSRREKSLQAYFGTDERSFPSYRYPTLMQSKAQLSSSTKTMPNLLKSYPKWMSIVPTYSELSRRHHWVALVIPAIHVPFKTCYYHKVPSEPRWWYEKWIDRLACLLLGFQRWVIPKLLWTPPMTRHSRWWGLKVTIMYWYWHGKQLK